MKTFLNIGVLLVSLGAFASSNDPDIYQYWFDNNISSRQQNTAVYDPQSKTLEIKTTGLSEGGHTLNFRMADKDRRWGGTSSIKFRIPTTPDASSNVAGGYRVFFNGNVIDQGPVPDPSNFEKTFAFPEDYDLNIVNSRDFTFLSGDRIKMTSYGKVSYAVQLLSARQDKMEWGAPLSYEFPLPKEDGTVTNLVRETIVPIQDISVPTDFWMDKVSNTGFKVFRFRNSYSNRLFIQPNQDCTVKLFYKNDDNSLSTVSPGYEYNLKKDEASEVYTDAGDRDVIAVFYNTPKDKQNSGDGLQVRFMLEDNIVPTPTIDLDPETWELIIKCADPRATIYYTLDGTTPTTESPQYRPDDNNPESKVYIGKFTRVMAYAVLYGFKDSEVNSRDLDGTDLQIPLPELSYVDSPGKNTFKLTNRVDGVTIYYTLGEDDVYDDLLRKEYQGEILTLEDGDYVNAYCVKDRLTNSELLHKRVSLSEYVTLQPSVGDRTYDEDENATWRSYKMSINVPEGKAFYRVQDGIVEFDESQPIETPWTPYDAEYNPYIHVNGNQTIQVYAELEGKARSAINNLHTDWIKAEQPKVDYMNYKLKFQTNTPGAIVRFQVYGEEEFEIYSSEKYPEGIDVKGIYRIDAYVEAEGYADSESLYFYPDNHNLSSPTVGYLYDEEDDGYFHIMHSDADVSLKIDVQPYQQMEEVEKNHFRFDPKYNTVVKVFAEKYGYNKTDTITVEPRYIPVINVNDYYVDISTGGWSADVYYTTDGTEPTRESTKYEGQFESEPCEINAVAFYNHGIPAKAEPVRVMDPAKEPEIIYNFSKTQTEDGPVEVKKVRFSCETPNAKIWYSIDNSLEGKNKIEYKWEEIDVTGARYIYAYAEAPNFRNSSQAIFNLNDAYLSSPDISVEGDNVVITHYDPTVTIVPKFYIDTLENPYYPAESDIEYSHEDELNRYTVKAVPNMLVHAYVEKWGYIPSETRIFNPLSKPEINVSYSSDNSDYVYIYYSGSELYYTTDGTQPTKDSNRYNGGFYARPTTIRAIAFQNGQIPSEVAKTARPEMVYNFTTQTLEDGSSKDVKKIKFESATQGAKIYYRLETDDVWYPYDPNNSQNSEDADRPSIGWDGLDLTEYLASGWSYIYSYAEADGMDESAQISQYIGDGRLSSPNVAMVDGKVEIWHDDPYVNIVPGITPQQEYEYEHDGETNKITFTPVYNTEIHAYAEKQGNLPSYTNDMYPISKPSVYVDYREDGHFVSMSSYYGNIYYTTDGTMPTKESTVYEDGFYTDPCTIRAVVFEEGYIPAETTERVLDQAAAPEIIFNYSVQNTEEGEVVSKKVKLSTSTQNARIWYSLSSSGISDSNRKLYDPNQNTDVDWEGNITIGNQTYISAYAEGDDYRRSDNVSRYLQDAYLSAPSISVKDGVVEIWHNDPTVTIVPEITPAQEYEYVHDGETNKITFTPLYNTVVRAYSSKVGYIKSEVNQRDPISKPEMNVSDDYVYLSSYGGTVYYTTDGTMPTLQSTPYEGGFYSEPCTIRYVAFSDYDIPSEGDPVKVLAKAAEPEITFNYSIQTTEDGQVEKKKVKLSCSTPDTKIYYSLGRSISDSNRKLYDPNDAENTEVDGDGVTIGDQSYIYAYAEGDNYRRSETASRYLQEAYLNTPNISVNDGVVEIWHDDPTVTIKPVFTPAQDYTYVQDGTTNKVTCKVAYNTVVKASVEKTGYIPSSVNQLDPINKPVIQVNGYNVYIDTYGWNVYYTTDGTMPTEMSIPYDGSFDCAKACTIRAVAFGSGWIPSEADPAKVMDQAAMPEVMIEGGYAKLSTSTPGATIYYSLDEGIGLGTRKVYDATELPNGIDITSVNVIRSYAEAPDYRQSETLVFNKDAYTLAAPMLSYSNGYVTADHDDDEVSIKFTDHEGNVLTAEASDPRKVKVGYNTTVNALAYRQGYVESRSVSVKHTDAPTITADLFKITIKGKSGQTLRYTLDGTQPTSKSAEYTEPFSLTASCKVRAAAFVDDLIPSEGTAVDITYRKSQKPQVSSYDGRYLTLSAEEGSSIRYILGATGDPELGTVANGKIDMEGLQMVRAIAQRSDADDSDVFSYTPEYYANETDAYSSKPGALKDAFGWISDKSGYTSLNVHGTLLGASTEDSGDYEFLRSMPNLRHLDLSNVTDEAIPAAAFDSKLISVALPTSLKTVGENVFGEDNTTLCSVELPAYANAPENLLDGVQNPNLLLYVKSSNYVTDLLAKAGNVVTNVVVLGTVGSSNRAESVTLTHAKAFYAPKEFNAQKISFTRAFTKETQIGGFGSGWETMVVPFDVQSIVCGDKTLKPFGEANTDRGECPFWLFSAGETDWMTAYSLMANTPYLLAMPNNPLYADEFVINGNVEFSSNNVTVPVTPEEEEMTYSFGTGKYIAGNYALIDKEENVLAINDETVTPNNTTYQPGGVFIAGQKDVVPFECYVLNSGASAIPVFDQNAIDQLLEDYGTRVWGENYCIYVRSSISMKVRVYDSVGQLIRSVDVKAGETVQISDITPGIYFVGSTKILVKG